MLAHLILAVAVLGLLAVALGLLLRSSRPVHAYTPRHKADHPLFDLSEIDWNWPR